MWERRIKRLFQSLMRDGARIMICVGPATRVMQLAKPYMTKSAHTARLQMDTMGRRPPTLPTVIEEKRQAALLIVPRGQGLAMLPMVAKRRKLEMLLMTM